MRGSGGRPRRRRARSRRRAARAGQGAAPVRLGQDPIARSRQTDAASGTMLTGLVVGALATHAVFTLGVGAIATAFATERGAAGESIRVQIQSTPTSSVLVPEPTADVESAAPAAAKPVVAKPVVAKPVAKPRPVEATRRRKSRPAAKVQPSAAPPPRRIVGADFGSTIKGGDGPSIAVGNALDGHTASAAVGPSKAQSRRSDAVPNTAAVSRNRVATIVPTNNAKVVKPKRHKQVVPDYPPLLKAQGLEANVVVEVQITANGLVKSVEIVAPAKQREFNAAAKAAALKEKFQPATRNGVAIAFRLTFTYRYRISR